MTGAERISAERTRQIEEEGWTPQHDDTHVRCELLDAALCYAGVAGRQLVGKDTRNVMQTAIGKLWPWGWDWWKPSDDPIRNLEKAGALIAAEIDRLQRLEKTSYD